MTKIKFNGDYLNNSINPTVSSARESFASAKNSSYYSLPSGFYQNGFLSEVPGRINNIIEKLDRFNGWVNRCQSLYNNADNDQLTAIRDVESVMIKAKPITTILQSSVK